MSNKYWGRINDLLRHGFVFKGIVELDLDGDPICISTTVNGKKTQGLVEIYKSVRFNYEAEISALGKDQKTLAIKEIILRNRRLNDIISDAEHQLTVEEAVPVHRRLLPEIHGDQFVEIEKTDPPCQDRKIINLKNYVSFAKDIFKINELELVHLGHRQKSQTGFLSTVSDEILKKHYNQLQSNDIIKCDYKTFKNVFLGKASGRIDWTESFAALVYFIGRIPEEGRLTSKIWMMTVKCFTHSGEDIRPEQLRHGAALGSPSIKEILDDVISGLFPMSHP